MIKMVLQVTAIAMLPQSHNQNSGIWQFSHTFDHWVLQLHPTSYLLPSISFWPLAFLDPCQAPSLLGMPQARAAVHQRALLFCAGRILWEEAAVRCGLPTKSRLCRSISKASTIFGGPMISCDHSKMTPRTESHGLQGSWDGGTHSPFPTSAPEVYI